MVVVKVFGRAYFDDEFSYLAGIEPVQRRTPIQTALIQTRILVLDAVIVIGMYADATMP